ncbi:MAG: malonyl-CoA decarboxylase [Noviherbaspirillum sp.]
MGWLDYHAFLAALRGAAPAGGRPRLPRIGLGTALARPREALAAREKRRILALLREAADPRIGDVEGGLRAREVACWYQGAAPEDRHEAWLLMSGHFGPDPRKVEAARKRYDAAEGTTDEGDAAIRLRRALVSPRARLLQRFAAFPEGMRFLVDMRAELLSRLPSDRRLAALEADLEGLFSSWFDVALLELRRISWDSPASLVEKLIRYEAVHDVRGWEDMKNRLDSDRRCYGFFHPLLPGEPLIFVEVALMDHIASAIMPLLDENAAPSDPYQASTAIFYSISSTQAGLRGISFGDALIKRVVKTLRMEFPRLKAFATLSPIPGFRSWLEANAEAMLAGLPPKRLRALAQALGTEAPGARHLLAAADRAAEIGADSPVRDMLVRCAARYLAAMPSDGKPADPVARFHLGNGARVERINWAADLSPRGMRQSFGLMVNYVYDLKQLDRNRIMLAGKEIPASRTVARLHG